jgi:selenocysteine-specific elongation factor
MTAHIVLGTAGHIDHGKTALIRALTGTDTDRLPEEKKRGITIDLGFASLSLPMPDGSPLQVSFVDVPGHARFVRNMLAGAGGVDAVLLVISAEEGVKPQTEEHLAICSFLGIQHGITVITKCDAVDGARLSDMRDSVARYLETTFLASEPMVEVSARTGAGLTALRHQLSLLVTRIPAREPEYLTRLPLDRAFALKGLGTIVTGTLIAGSVAAGQTLAIEPGARVARVRGLQMHGKTVANAKAATRVAVNLSRIEVSEVRRGDTIVEPSTIVAVDTIDVELRLLDNAPALKHRARVHLHAFASETMATIALYGYHPIEPKTTRLARLRLAKPIVLLPGDRFVLRQGTPIITVGGGVVLDAHPIERLKKIHTHAWLRHMIDADQANRLALRVVRRGTTGISIGELERETGFRTDAIGKHLRSSLHDGQIRRLDHDVFLSREALLDAEATVHAHLATLFLQNDSGGVKRSSLASQARLRPEVLDHVLGALERAGKLTLRGELLFSPESGGQGTARNEQMVRAVDRAYESAGLSSPAPAELAAKLAMDATQIRQAITILLRQKKLVRLGDDSLCVHQSALADLKQKVQSLKGSTLDVGQFKQLADVSRKYAIPLLEYFDRERVTRKLGDLRIVL